jgi:osmotically inducible lipoprotein OsmB
MSNVHTLLGPALNALGLAVLMGLGGCAGISPREQNTAAGAGIGAAAGAILTGGSGVGTVGGAAIGGIIGNEAAKK